MDHMKNMGDHESNQTDGRHGAAAYEINVLFEFVVPGVLLNIIGMLGLLGNILSIVILSRPQMKSSIHCLLLGLASYDSVLILTSILMFGLPAVYTYTQQKFFAYYFYEVFPFITPVVYPVGMIAQTGSVYLTLCVSVERYVAVCLPLKARAICTFGRARCYVISLGVFAFLYNIPRFWEVTWHTVFYPDMKTNVTTVVPTPLRDNPTYISVYITWLYLVVMYIVPFTCLAAFNLLIYHQVRRANSERARLTRLQKKEIGLATMLMVVVFVFFVCNVLALVVNILEVMKINIIALNNVSNTLVTLNSSVNFIIYCIFGEKFKKIFFRIFCPFLLKGRDQHDFVQRYPEGGALGGPADRGFLGVPKRRNSTSALANSSKAANIRARADTLTTRDTLRSRDSSQMDESCRMEMTHFKSRQQKHSRQHHCNIADEDDYDDEESGREEEEGPLIRATLVSASSIPVFLSSRQQHSHHNQAPNGGQCKAYGSVVNGASMTDRFSVHPMIHHDQEGQRQRSVYIPKHDISITVNINTCSKNNNIASEVVTTTTTTSTMSPLQQQQQTNQFKNGDTPKTLDESATLNGQKVNNCCQQETDESTRVRLTCISSQISLSLIQEENSVEISNDDQDPSESRHISNGFSVQSIENNLPTKGRHYVTPSNFTDEEKETLFRVETSQSRHELEPNDSKVI